MFFVKKEIDTQIFVYEKMRRAGVFLNISKKLQCFEQEGKYKHK